MCDSPCQTGPTSCRSNQRAGDDPSCPAALEGVLDNRHTCVALTGSELTQNVLKKASRNNNAGHTSVHASDAAQWDIAIAVAPGRHVTVFTAWGLAICVAAILIVAAIAVSIWLLWN